MLSGINLKQHFYFEKQFFKNISILNFENSFLLPNIWELKSSTFFILLNGSNQEASHKDYRPGRKATAGIRETLTPRLVAEKMWEKGCEIFEYF